MAFGPHPPPIQAYICVKDGSEAIAFYERAFGAVCTFKKMAADGKRVMHANLDMCGSEVMLHDEFPEFGGILMSPMTRAGASVGVISIWRRQVTLTARSTARAMPERWSFLRRKIHLGARAMVRSATLPATSGRSMRPSSLPDCG